MRNIKVLIVDDSLFFREFLKKNLSTDPHIEVVATATDPYDARDKILQFEPDVMTCDIEMPKMNGIDFIKKLLPQYEIPIVIVSSINKFNVELLEKGAVDFLPKPNYKSSEDIHYFIINLIKKIKSLLNTTMFTSNGSKDERTQKANTNSNSKYDIVAIGASTGGIEAITNILRDMDYNIPGIVIVQHIPPGFSKMFAQRLNTMLKYEVKEATSGEYIEENKILIAPGDKHMRVVKAGKKYKVECFDGEKMNGHCPSVDILFDSVATVLKSRAIGVLLTGMGYDGAKGLLKMKRMGALTIGQDEKSSVVYGMPKVAENIGAVNKQLSIDKISKEIYNSLY
ncbi:two-component system chemotaxis response regulator CheB [Natranaerovirga pectinivora]|uniref:Protein-glutamate methylesterase/protein-glutamine glutaminase n=1 Tax=Natranaerovirga pectinivora TaxID=682400 RepID=A0A4R3MGC1_9FIRM|nr:chemotaxis response regulator protein-glutamate methylesterase [Natranaerovirga pectinivora]TCT12133.1 two-component system chemotaxis response regulator CheB [Natranaerovirga pectinivora]